MCGCCSCAAILISRRNRSAPERRGQFGAQHLDRDLAAMLEVFGEVDRRHPTRAELALERVAVGEGGLERVERRAHETFRQER